MKRTLFAAALIAVMVFSACTNKKAEEQLVTQKALQDSIESVLASKNAEVEMLFQQLNEDCDWLFFGRLKWRAKVRQFGRHLALKTAPKIALRMKTNFPYNVFAPQQKLCQKQACFSRSRSRL